MQNIQQELSKGILTEPRSLDKTSSVSLESPHIFDSRFLCVSPKCKQASINKIQLLISLRLSLSSLGSRVNCLGLSHWQCNCRFNSWQLPVIMGKEPCLRVKLHITWNVFSLQLASFLSSNRDAYLNSTIKLTKQDRSYLSKTIDKSILDGPSFQICSILNHGIRE